MFARLMRAFRPLDTSAVDAAIAEAHHQQKQVRVRARALRMDISCADPSGRVSSMAHRLRASAGAVLREMYGAPVQEPIPASLQQLLDQI